jgi:glucosamine--fructose-6-phosphate aminotransferase (isomerizing)
MARETEESAAAVDRLLTRESKSIADLAARIAHRAPAVLTTSARGSSDHSATYFKYLFEICCGLPVASLGPSVVSVYGADLRLKGGVHLTVSQSGASPDIVALQSAARVGGSLTVAFLNVTDSPVGRDADIVIPLHAGEERSVAATKSFIAACAALAALTAGMSRDPELSSGLRALPSRLADVAPDFGPAAELLAASSSLYTAGRGPGFAMALEAALKAKETAALHAEAFSLAELMHGPARLAGSSLPVLAFLPHDAAFAANAASVARLAALASPIVTIGDPVDGSRCHIPAASTGSGLLDPIIQIGVYYRLIEKVARLNGSDPDRPPNLRKVTQTI